MKPAIERLLLNATITTEGCWLAGKDGPDRYVSVSLGRRADGTVLAHRLSYEHFVGPIPPELTVDHTCFVRRCVNYTHLRLRTHVQNAADQRQALSDRCRAGHLFTPATTYYRRGGRGKRFCLICYNARRRERYAKRVSAVPIEE